MLITLSLLAADSRPYCEVLGETRYYKTIIQNKKDSVHKNEVFGYCTLKTEQRELNSECGLLEKPEYQVENGSSPRPISTAKLNVSLRLHMQPINLLVYEGSY